MRIRLSLLCSFAFFFSAHAAMAAGISLTAPTQVKVGQVFQVVATASGAVDVDTMRLQGTFPADLLEWQNAVPGPALSSVSPGNNVNQTSGTFYFGAFSLTNRLNGTGRLATLTFRAKKAGKATVRLVSGSHLLSAGEEQLSSLGQVTISIASAPAPIPAVPLPPAAPTPVLLQFHSTSHPDPDVWYTDPNIVVAWVRTPDVKTVYTGFDQSPEGPADKIQTGQTAQFHAAADGVWYVHFVVVFKDGTSQRLDFRVMIDRQPPNPVSPAADQTNVPPSVPNFLRYGTTDDTSGVKNYAITIDGTLATTTSLTFFPLSALSVGHHVASVTAYDYAGNKTSGETSFDLIEAVPVSAPEAAAAARQQLAILSLALLFFVLAFILFIFRFYRRKKAKKVGIKSRSKENGM